MEPSKDGSPRLRGRALPGSSVLRSSRYGMSWALGTLATLLLVGSVMVMEVWDHSALTARSLGMGGNTVVLTADAAPPALWSNTWLGRRPYRSVAFHGLRRFATGFSLVLPQKPKTLSQDLSRIGPAISLRLVEWRNDIAADAKQTFVARARM